MRVRADAHYCLAPVVLPVPLAGRAESARIIPPRVLSASESATEPGDTSFVTREVFPRAKRNQSKSASRARPAMIHGHEVPCFRSMLISATFSSVWGHASLEQLAYPCRRDDQNIFVSLIQCLTSEERVYLGRAVSTATTAANRWSKPIVRLISPERFLNHRQARRWASACVAPS